MLCLSVLERMDDNKILKKEIIIKNKQIQELYVLIDTMQTNLRSATSHNIAPLR